jgi:hypothetical protein
MRADRLVDVVALTLTLCTIAIRRVQRIPLWAAALAMIAAYLLWTYGIEATFVR